MRADQPPSIGIQQLCDDQLDMFGGVTPWQSDWQAMPRFAQDDLLPKYQVIVNFETPRDVERFAQLVQQTVTTETRSLWYPAVENADEADKRWFSQHEPQHPIYIVTKGRWDTLITHRALCAMRTPHYLIVEQQELRRYSDRIDHTYGKLLVLDPAFQTGYDTCDDLGDSKSYGPGPARNFAWDHSRFALGAAWHWVMDDNINGFFRLHANRKIRVADGGCLFAMEDFASRFGNVAMAGPNYHFFAKRKQLIPPFITNTRIYSCNLIRNDTQLRWRGRYNEDTILSIDMLKQGFCTVQFNAFLQNKAATQTVQGGNTAEFYKREGTKPKSEMLARVHPDYARESFKFSRDHHEVDYSRFTQALQPVASHELRSAMAQVEDYGFTLRQQVSPGVWKAVDDESRQMFYTPLEEHSNDGEDPERLVDRAASS
jgi:hypothetical protein